MGRASGIGEARRDDRGKDENRIRTRTTNRTGTAWQWQLSLNLFLSTFLTDWFFDPLAADSSLRLEQE